LKKLLKKLLKKSKSDDFGYANSLDSNKEENCMSNALGFVTVASVISIGILLHTGHPFLAICVGLAAYAAARWIYMNYA
jgi:hypothetical protein